MNQKLTNRNRWKKLHIDERGAEDIEKRVIELAESYETGWYPDQEVFINSLRSWTIS